PEAGLGFPYQHDVFAAYRKGEVDVQFLSSVFDQQFGLTADQVYGCGRVITQKKQWVSDQCKQQLFPVEAVLGLTFPAVGLANGEDIIFFDPEG
ncbi:hypothetical protein ACFL0S_10975, partial [Thermodesulfobacteriota bacterium]